MYYTQINSSFKLLLWSVFLRHCTSSFLLSLTEQVLKKQVMVPRWKFNIIDTKITVFMIKRHLKSIFIWQILEHYHFGQQLQEYCNTSQQAIAGSMSSLAVYVLVKIKPYTDKCGQEGRAEIYDEDRKVRGHEGEGSVREKTGEILLFEL